jgi:hypothetical protein
MYVYKYINKYTWVIRGDGWMIESWTFFMGVIFDSCH